MQPMPTKSMPRRLLVPAGTRVQRWTGPFGAMALAGDDAGLLGVWFEGQKHCPDLPAADPSAAQENSHPILLETQAQLQAYFEGRLLRFDLPLDLRSGTAFQQSVWQLLRAIPYGASVTYAALSQQIGKPMAVRAVAAAIGRNPLSIVVPCHRVLGSNGSLTGYAGGLARKAALLQLEKQAPK